MRKIQVVTIGAVAVIISITGSLAAVLLLPNIFSGLANDRQPEIIDSYEIFWDGDRIIRLDRSSGDLLLINETTISAFDQESQSMKQINDFPNTDIFYPVRTADKIFPQSQGAFWQRIEYKLIGDQLRYKYEWGPYIETLNEKLGETVSMIHLIFTDIDGFEVLRSTVRLNSPTRIHGADGSIAHLQYEGSIDCSSEIYDLISAVSVTWMFDDVFSDALNASIPEAEEMREEQLEKLRDVVEDSGLPLVIGSEIVFRITEDDEYVQVSPRDWESTIHYGELMRGLYVDPAPDSEPINESSEGLHEEGHVVR